MKNALKLMVLLLFVGLFSSPCFSGGYTEKWVDLVLEFEQSPCFPARCEVSRKFICHAATIGMSPSQKESWKVLLPLLRNEWQGKCPVKGDVELAALSLLKSKETLARREHWLSFTQSHLKTKQDEEAKALERLEDAKKSDTGVIESAEGADNIKKLEQDVLSAQDQVKKIKKDMEEAQGDLKKAQDTAKRAQRAFDAWNDAE